MQLNINIEDNHLQEQIAEYIAKKQIEANDFMIELVQHFFNKNETPLNYKVQNPELSSTTIDFGLETQNDYKLFEEVTDVKNYARELRDNAWR